MAAIDPWDATLEGVTAALGRFTAGPDGEVRVGSAAGWNVAFQAHRRTVSIAIWYAGAAPGPRLDDYRLVLLYGLDFHPAHDDPRTNVLRKTLTIQEGWTWDEQTLREVVLETLGLLRHVLGVPAEPPLTLFEEAPRAGPVRSLTRGKLPARRKR